MRSIRITAKTAPTASEQRERACVRARVGRASSTATDAIADHQRHVDGARRELRCRSAAASAHTSQTPACHVCGAVVAVPDAAWRVGSRRTASLRRGRHVGLTCPLDNGCAQPGCCVRFPGLGPGTGEVGARPTLTRNCERLCGTRRTPRARLPAVVHRATGAPIAEAACRAADNRPSWNRGHGGLNPCRTFVVPLPASSRCRHPLFAGRAPRGDRYRRRRWPRQIPRSSLAEGPAAVRRRLRARRLPRLRDPRRHARHRRASPDRNAPGAPSEAARPRSRPCSSAAPGPRRSMPRRVRPTIPTLGALTAGTAAKTIVLGASPSGSTRPPSTLPATARRSTW